MFLKESDRLRGRKRQLSDGSNSEDEFQSSLKRLRESLNLSDTCEQISQILLRNVSGEEESYCETSGSSYSIEEKFGESSIIEPSCSKTSIIEEKFGESSILEPLSSEIFAEEVGESSVLAPPSSESGGVELDLTGSANNLSPLCDGLDDRDIEIEREALANDNSIGAASCMVSEIDYEQDWSSYLIEMEYPSNDEDEASDSSVRQLSLHETDSSAGERLSIDLSIDEYSDLEHQAYADDFRLIIPNGWGLYEASLEGGHQLAELGLS